MVFAALLLPVTLAAQAGDAGAGVTVTVSGQGTQAVAIATGYTPKTAALARLDTCNEGDAISVSTARIAAAVIRKEGYSIYSSDVVADVLNVLQQKDVWTRAQKAITAGSNTVTLLTALFRTASPQTVAILQAGPAIAQAILPAVADPRDLATLSRQIMQDNGTLALGKKGSGNDCHTSLVVTTSAEVKSDSILIH